MPELEFKATGLADLQRQLDALPAKLEKNILRGAIRASAKPIVDAAKRMAPVLKDPDERRIAGALRQSIRARSVRFLKGMLTGGVVAGGKVNVGRGSGKRVADPFYAVILEYGKTTRTKHPFMRPAADTNIGAAIDAMADYIRRRLGTELKK